MMLYYYFKMILNDEMEQQFDSLTLEQILQTDDLILEEVLSIKNIHNMIKGDLEIFINYCKSREQFTDRLIILGLKCPMHESSNAGMKKMAFICNDILTSDRSQVAELIMWTQFCEKPNEKTDKGQICRHYKYLDKVVNYFNEPYLDQTCINYIGKVLVLLTNWKYIESFAKYLKKHVSVFQKLISLSLYPSMAHLFSKFLTFSSEYYSSDIVNEFKITIISSLLTKVHEQISEEPTSLIFYCFEQVLNFIRRRGENQPNDNVPYICNLMVSKSEIGYHLNIIVKALTAQTKSLAQLYSLNNSLNYLNIVINRIQLEYVNEDQPLQCRPIISYKIDELFSSFCKFLHLSIHLEQFLQFDKSTARLMTLQYMETLRTMCRLKNFYEFYAKFQLNSKILALNALISLICQQTNFGLIFQASIALLQAILLREEQLLQKGNTSQNVIAPIEIYSILAEQKQELQVQVYKMANLIKNNKNVKNIHVRKLLMLIDTYYNKYRLVRKSQKSQTLQTLFHGYTAQNCKRYYDYITVQCGYPLLEYSFPNEESFTFFKRNKASSQIVQNHNKQMNVENVAKLTEDKQTKQNQERTQTQLTEESCGETDPIQDKKTQISPIETPSIIDSPDEVISPDVQFIQSMS